MIPKSDLVGRYVMYIDKNAAWRCEKVIKITGKTLTLLNYYNERHRVHPDTVKILGALKNSKVKGLSYKDYLEDIKWK